MLNNQLDNDNGIMIDYKRGIEYDISYRKREMMRVEKENKEEMEKTLQ